ncbi:UDP-2,3-diacylglucosamine diphosphatase [Pasteurella skyensis]|uniref:UDP-2,3-diacylglucosamine hydrolase n=1 Tax=Phocoenobacter skyensis TaxID=97481 RepID=A0AAJ6P2I4_9PAST|nr:UDP-2,3-diacylglucosamine diphosphatase [Pasteurella skyensis]MDP8170692.1 UDP-2,3-diacylglucosamine diphosphatase [Pasteurella skyensis]MDP8174827.1 UDP-2,3-diacylglucosamine diphosphatase [Pasteurella skyensis]
MHYYFISDLHLSESQPEITQHFLQFLTQKAPLACELYILGDFFDFWIGDDEQSDLISTVKQSLKTLTQQGVNCYFICGNRDFLIGKRFALETGITLLPDYKRVTLFDKHILLCHGDTLCIDDVNYQNFRKKVHNKWIQGLFLKLPLKLRIAIAQKIRAKSRLNKQGKPIEIMDINPEFTLQIMQQYQADWLIHGHTHKQNIHFCKFSDTSDRYFTRIVLGDWHKDKTSILRLDENGFRFEDK